MILTTKYKDLPATLCHQISGAIDIEEVEAGLEELIRELNEACRKWGSVHLIINAQGVHFASLIAHRTWSEGLKNFPAKEKIRYCAFVIGDSPSGRAEKEYMDSERMQFFFDFDKAVTWLREKVRRVD